MRKYTWLARAGGCTAAAADTPVGKLRQSKVPSRWTVYNSSACPLPASAHTCACTVLNLVSTPQRKNLSNCSPYMHMRTTAQTAPDVLPCQTDSFQHRCNTPCLTCVSTTPSCATLFSGRQQSSNCSWNHRQLPFQGRLGSMLSALSTIAMLAKPQNAGSSCVLCCSISLKNPDMVPCCSASANSKRPASSKAAAVQKVRNDRFIAQPSGLLVTLQLQGGI